MGRINLDGEYMISCYVYDLIQRNILTENNIYNIHADNAEILTHGKSTTFI